MKVMIAALLSSALVYSAAEDVSSRIKTETLLQSTASWDGTPYKAYPAGQPKITVLKITIAANTVMNWLSHPFPNAGYVLSGELTLEKKDGTTQRFVAGQAIAETVNSVHRGVIGAKPVVLIVFYSGTPDLPLSY